MSQADQTETPSAGASVSELNGVGQARSDDLENAGYETAGDLRDQDPADVAEAAGIPETLAETIVDQATPSGLEAQSSLGDARSMAAKIPGAQAKMVRVDGRQMPKVLEKTGEKNLPGATLEIRKG